MSPNINNERGPLGQMTVGPVQYRYVEDLGEPVRGRPRQYLIRRIVCRLQANAEGGLTERALRRAEQLADDADVRLSPLTGGNSPGGVGSARRRAGVAQSAGLVFSSAARLVCLAGR